MEDEGMNEHTLLIKENGKNKLKIYDPETDYLDEMQNLIAEFSSFPKLLEAKINDSKRFPLFTDITISDIYEFMQKNGWKPTDDTEKKDLEKKNGYE